MKPIHAASRINYFLYALLLTSLITFGCENSVSPNFNDTDLTVESSKLKGAPSASETAYNTGTGTFEGYTETSCPAYGIYSYNLWAGKTNLAGTVTISNDDSNLYVTYNTNETADLGEVHVYIWTNESEIPTKRPAPGHAPYKAENLNTDSYTLTIPMAINCGDIYYISTHAALVQDETDSGEIPSPDSNAGETAYAGGTDTPHGFANTKGAWWGYVSYTIECFYDVSGTVYDDANNNSDLDGESGFAGILVTLTDADGNSQTTTTFADGSYLFEHLPAGGDYSITVEGPADYTATENAGGYSIVDLNECQTDIDFGFYQEEDGDDDGDGDGDNNGNDDGQHETAFAFGGDSNCFLNDGFSRWGWNMSLTDGQSITTPVYAGAGRCDTTKGTYVGTFSVTRNGATITATYNLDAPFHMDEAHVYSGLAEYPFINGTATVAPGQYTVVTEGLNQATTYTTTIEVAGGADADVIWVIAHAVTGGF